MTTLAATANIPNFGAFDRAPVPALNDAGFNRKFREDIEAENHQPEAKQKPDDLYLYVRKNYHHWFNWATIGLHTLGATLPFISFVPKTLSDDVKKAAVNFSKYGVPFVVKLITGLEALDGKRTFEAIARFVPTALMPTVPFHNFQVPYGLSSGINITLDQVMKKTGDLKKEDGFAVNNKKVIDGFKDLVSDLFKPQVDFKERTRIFLSLGGSALMFLGAIPMMLFARNDLNSTFSKIFGSLRALGGFKGDLSLIFFPPGETEKIKKTLQKVGQFFLVPTVMDLMQRFMNLSEDANEIFNHAKTALNTVAEVMWSSISTERNVNQKQDQEPQGSLHGHQSV